MSKLHKLTALSDELQCYFSSALTGKICKTTDQSEYMEFGSQQSPVSLGLSEGYAVQDIAYFYVARKLGCQWIEDMLDNLDEQYRSRLEIAFEEFREDVRSEKKYAIETMRQKVSS